MATFCFHGVLAGHPVDDVRIELCDGSYHDIDSSEEAFRIAGAMAFRDAVKSAGPVLLEPVMRVEVVVPTKYVHHVIANLSGRRGQIHSQDDRGSIQMIGAYVPPAGRNRMAGRSMNDSAGRARAATSTLASTGQASTLN